MIKSSLFHSFIYYARRQQHKMYHTCIINTQRNKATNRPFSDSRVILYIRFSGIVDNVIWANGQESNTTRMFCPVCTVAASGTHFCLLRLHLVYVVCLPFRWFLSLWPHVGWDHISKHCDFWHILSSTYDSLLRAIRPVAQSLYLLVPLSTKSSRPEIRERYHNVAASSSWSRRRFNQVRT